MKDHVYHWKHGWIPLTHFAALQKAHGSQKGAARFLDKSNGMHGTESHKLKSGLASVGHVTSMEAASIKEGDIVHEPGLGGKTHRLKIDKAYPPKSDGSRNVDVTDLGTVRKSELTLQGDGKKHNVERRS